LSEARSREQGVGRREALRRLAAGGVGAAASTLWVDQLNALAHQRAMHAHAATVLAGQKGTEWAGKVLNPHQLQTVATLSELIIPETDTPGARAALVDRFIDAVLAAAPRRDRSRFLKGLAWMDARSRMVTGSAFASATPAQQADLLTRLSADGSREEAAGIEFFSAIKGMTITGYYTSEIGLRQELGDDGVLAQATFEGCGHAGHQGSQGS
jgi:hypothetical protein